MVVKMVVRPIANPSEEARALLACDRRARGALLDRSWLLRRSGLHSSRGHAVSYGLVDDRLFQASDAELIQLDQVVRESIAINERQLGTKPPPIPWMQALP
jgi:hypothetical protein